MSENGYAQVARPNNGHKVIKRGVGSDEGIELTNQHVVPYCPYLLLEFECHINVECVHSVKSFKYIHKYIYKGRVLHEYLLANTNIRARHEINTRIRTSMIT